jgi:hypothetical protein
MIDNLRDDAGSLQHWLADTGALAAGIQQDAIKLQLGTDFGVAIIQLHHVAFANPVLPGTIFENRVHQKTLGSKVARKVTD